MDGPRLSRRRFLRWALGSAATAALYTWKVEPHWLEIVRRPLAVPSLPPELAGRTLALLSDLHVGPKVEEAYLVETFSRVAALEPDVVAVAGDFTSYSRSVFARAERVFAHLPRGRWATVGVFGNHDYGPHWAHAEVADAIGEILRGHGLEVLRNERRDLGGLALVGLDDVWGTRFEPRRALDGLGAGTPALVLSHNPDTADLPVWGDFRGWILAGHTHGGQCRPPFLPPPILPVRNRRYTAGELALAGGRRLYISRGVGHLLEVRFNVRPEATLFTLEPAPPALPGRSGSSTG